jgi:uncharacterized integral membrane protein (TIGR00697 family)
MPNEFYFFLHLGVLLVFTFGILRLGCGALQAFVALQAVFANLFVLKQTTLLGFEVTCSDVYAVGSLLSLNLLREFWGSEAAKRAVGISLIALLFFAAMGQMNLLYRPSPGDISDGSFRSLFSATPRMVGASLAVYWIVQVVDLRLFSILQTLFEGRRLGLRLGLAIACSQAVDTVLFSFLGLYGLVASVADVIVVSIAVKWAAIGCSAPFCSWSRRFVRVE